MLTEGGTTSKPLPFSSLSLCQTDIRQTCHKIYQKSVFSLCHCDSAFVCFALFWSWARLFASFGTSKEQRWPLYARTWSVCTQRRTARARISVTKAFKWAGWPAFLARVLMPKRCLLYPLSASRKHWYSYSTSVVLLKIVFITQKQIAHVVAVLCALQKRSSFGQNNGSTLKQKHLYQL